LAHGVETNALHQTFGVDVRVKRLSIVKANSPPARMRVMDLVLHRGFAAVECVTFWGCGESILVS
jgi:hypothetical protein